MLFSISNLSFGWLNFTIGNYDIKVSQLHAPLFINDLIKNLLSIIKLEKSTTFTYVGNETSSFSIAFMRKQETYSFAFFSDDIESTDDKLTKDKIEHNNLIYMTYGWEENIDFMQLVSSVVAELKPFTSKEGKYYYSSMWDNGVIHNSDSLYSFPLSAFAELEKFSPNTTFKNTFITKEINKYYYLKNNYRSYFPSFTNEFSGEKNAIIRNFLVASNDFLWGVVNETFESVVSIKYIGIYEIRNNLWKGYQCASADKSFNVDKDFGYYYRLGMYKTKPNTKKHLKFTLDDLHGNAVFKDLDIPPQFFKMKDENNFLYLLIKKNGRWGVATTEGRYILNTTLRKKEALRFFEFMPEISINQ